MSDVFSFDELLSANGTKYATVECHGKTLRLGSLSSASMIAWLKINNSEGPEGSTAGVNLLVRSIVSENGERIPEARYQEFIDAFMAKDSADNRKAIKKAREVNGLEDLARTAEALKNASGEVKTDASPSGSQPPQAE